MNPGSLLPTESGCLNALLPPNALSARHFSRFSVLIFWRVALPLLYGRMINRARSPFSSFFFSQSLQFCSLTPRPSPRSLFLLFSGGSPFPEGLDLKYSILLFASLIFCRYWFPIVQWSTNVERQSIKSCVPSSGYELDTSRFFPICQKNKV